MQEEEVKGFRSLQIVSMKSFWDVQADEQCEGAMNTDPNFLFLYFNPALLKFGALKRIKATLPCPEEKIFW